MKTTKAIRLGVVIQIDAGQCIGCAICADVCATGALLVIPLDNGKRRSKP